MLQDLLSVLSGSLVGFVLGLIGGGGSILAVPLLVYVVGVPQPHVAIGTSAVAVGLSAFASLVGHWRNGNVRWPCATVFTAAGVLGASLGSTIGKLVDGRRLLAAFGALMIVVAFMMLRRKPVTADAFTPLDRTSARWLAPRLAGYGLGVGALAGFFGIGGGFLVVPGLVAASGMPMLTAVGTSLVSVTAFGLTTAASYALSGLIDWRLVALFVGGGVLGSFFGSSAASALARRKQMLTQVFAAIVACVGLYVVARGIMGI